MNRDKFWFAYNVDRTNRTALRVYRYSMGLMERKQKDGSWREAPEQCCIFFGEDMDYEDISEEEANCLRVKF
ncbi:MAG: hypothetical protein IKH28_14215 [Lachnospiraceae bacterium]|nr:hypothetical protein [Lachnospiraceae bacterium]